MKRYMAVALAIIGLMPAGPLLADTVRVQGGEVTLDVSDQDMSRLTVQGEKITSVRTLDDPSGPHLLVQNDPGTGDVFIGFEGDTSGRIFSLFLTTQRGDTIQVRLHPGASPARTFELVPELVLRTPPVTGGAPGFAEKATAFMKVMFTGKVTDGITYRPSGESAVPSGHLLIRTVGYYSGDGMRGIVMQVTSRNTVPQPLTAEQFLVSHVLCAGVSNDLLRPGESAFVYLAEEGQ